MPAYLAPGLYYASVDAGQERIAALRTDIAAFIGLAERGPLHQPVLVQTFEQYQARFGGFVSGAYLSYAVKAFFENGGRACYVLRTAAPEKATTSSGLQPADRLASGVASLEGFVPGAAVTIRQGDHLAGDYLLKEVDAISKKLVWYQPLDPAFDLNLSLDFATGAGLAQGVLLDGNGKPTLRLLASSPGAWGNGLTVRLAQTSRHATRTAGPGAQPVGGLESQVERVLGFEPGRLVRVVQIQPAPVTAYRRVSQVNPARKRITWDAPLIPAFDLGQPISFETVEFSLSVYLKGRLLETHARLSMTAADCRQVGDSPYVVCALQRDSRWIQAEDLHSLSVYQKQLPDPQAANLKRGVLSFHGGRDGLAGLRMEDFTGSQAGDELLGVRALEEVDPVAILAAPDVLIRAAPEVILSPLPKPQIDPCLLTLSPEEAPSQQQVFHERLPQFSLDEIMLVQQALIDHCEKLRDRIVLLDPPLFSASGQHMDVAEIQTWRSNFVSKYAALYFPWLLVPDPLPGSLRAVQPVPPSGHVAGIYARTDREVGVHKAPANVDLFWAQGVTAEVNEAIQAGLNPLAINCIRAFPGRGLRVFGARTLSDDSAWIYVNVRRLLMMIEEALELSLQWAVFEPNDYILRERVSLSIASFLETLWKHGALAGDTPEQAFFIRCDEVNNPPYLIEQGQFVAQVGVAPIYPAEFVIFNVGRTEDELEISEQWRQDANR
ncbi:MAG: phage tail sheath C-terminal domain-containing protein [Chloroflexota bacterium]